MVYFWQNSYICAENLFDVSVMKHFKVFRMALLAMMLMGAAAVSAQVHLTFDGIPLDGSYQMFKKKLLAKGYKYAKENEETSSPAIWGKPPGFLDREVGLFVRYSNDRNQTVGGVTAVMYEFNKFDYEALSNYHTRTNKGATSVATYYKYDETPDMERVDHEVVVTIPNRGTVTVWDGVDMDENPVLTVEFRDAQNIQLIELPDYKDPAPVTYDIARFVSCASGCKLSVINYVMELSGNYNGRKFRIQARDSDKDILAQLMDYNNNQEVKSTLLNTYVYSVVRDNLPENTIAVTSKRMEKVIYAYVDAQRRAREQQKPTVRGVLWGMLKDYLYTPKEKAQMDRIIPKQVQEQMFQGIFGAVGGSGPTNFDMLSPAQQAVIHQSSNGR